MVGRGRPLAGEDAVDIAHQHPAVGISALIGDNVPSARSKASILSAFSRAGAKSVSVHKLATGPNLARTKRASSDVLFARTRARRLLHGSIMAT